MVYALPTLGMLKSISTALIFCLTLWTFSFLYLGTPALKATHLDSSRLTNFESSTGFLDFMNKIYVISLPDRRSRLEDMEKLRLTLGLHWSYTDALPADDPLISRIVKWISLVRNRYSENLEGGHQAESSKNSVHRTASFSWPEDIDKLAASDRDLDMWSSDSDISTVSLGNLSSLPSPLTCATGDYEIATFSSTVPEHLVLTPARIACWHSHLSVIHVIANDFEAESSGAALILEDDVDMEKDIVKQLRNLWPLLPVGWDIVFLGHCWSDERRGRPLIKNASDVLSEKSPFYQLYVSTSPKCTHAYALSRIGARRLLLHLQYSPFAYSRAIDQAFSWLIESGRLNSFSIVPSLVVQRKVEPSDVMPGLGSKWKDRLINGILS